jgi:hypothetical protein
VALLLGFTNRYNSRQNDKAHQRVPVGLEAQVCWMGTNFANITSSGSLVKPKDVIPYFDKVVVWLLQPADKATIKELKKQCAHLHKGRKPARWNSHFRQRLEFKRPSPEALRWIASRNDALISQVEFALDYIFATWDDRDDAYDFLDQHLIRRWHGKKQPIVIYPGKNQTRYDAPRSARNKIVFYRQPHSRITGELYCLHTEWRSNGNKALEGIGSYSGKDLANFDHHKFWKKRLVLCRLLDEDRVGRFIHNFDNKTKRRQSDPDDARRGHTLCVLSAQQAIDSFGKRYRIQRVMQKLSTDGWLPNPCSYQPEPPTRNQTYREHTVDYVPLNEMVD